MKNVVFFFVLGIVVGSLSVCSVGCSEYDRIEVIQTDDPVTNPEMDDAIPDPFTPVTDAGTPDAGVGAGTPSDDAGPPPCQAPECNKRCHTRGRTCKARCDRSWARTLSSKAQCYKMCEFGHKWCGCHCDSQCN